MKIFLDTANVKEIKEIAELGLVDGVTTNPTLVAKEGRGFKETIVEICKVVKGPVSAEVVSLDSDGMIKEAKKVSSWAENIVIKIPMTEEGMKAVRKLSKEGIKTNITLVFSANQAIIAAKAGGSYVSPFLGRLDDVGTNGMDLLYDIMEIYELYGFTTEVIAASIRHPLHIVEAAKTGVHIITLPPSVIKQMFKHPLTDIGIKRFLDDWAKVPKKDI